MRQSMDDLLAALRHRDIDEHYINFFKPYDRADFIPEMFKPHAYDDSALPIGNGQTISQPSLLALMLQHLPQHKEAKILEIGTGSGYFAALLASYYERVYTIERIRALWQQSCAIYKYYNLNNIITLYADGMQGWVEQAPFDAVILSASLNNIPPILFKQLKSNGLIISPIGDDMGKQQLYKITNNNGTMSYDILEDVRFVPVRAGIM